jgi:hypothetical protein
MLIAGYVNEAMREHIRETMLLLEIGYSEKYDTFTGYVCNQSEYVL